MTTFPTRAWHLGEFDNCRAYGIRRPADLPPDDDITDLAAWLAAQFDGLAAQPFTLDGDGGR